MWGEGGGGGGGGGMMLISTIHHVGLDLLPCVRSSCACSQYICLQRCLGRQALISRDDQTSTRTSQGKVFTRTVQRLCAHFFAVLLKTTTTTTKQQQKTEKQTNRTNNNKVKYLNSKSVMGNDGGFFSGSFWNAVPG